MLKRFALGILIIAFTLPSCRKGEDTTAIHTAPSTVDANRVVADYRATDTSRDSSMKMRATISDTSGGTVATNVVEMIIYRKRGPSGGQSIFIEFTSPAEERDRDVIVKVGPDGEVEATRYMQSNDSFVSAGGVMTEDSLFGMTLQELADGQTEKYNFKTLGEESHGGAAVYRIEGNLRPPAQSKFPRLVLLISKENNLVKSAEFYDSQNNLARRLTVESAEQVAGHWTRKQWTIDNFSRQKKIEFEMLEAKYDQQLSDSLFGQERLKRLATK